MELHFLNGIYLERRVCVKSVPHKERGGSSGCLGFKSIIVPYSRASPSNAIDFLRPPCENYLAEFTLFRGKPSWKSMKLRHVRGQDIRRHPSNWRKLEREVKGRTTGEREKGEKRKINVEGEKRRVRSFRGNGIKNHLGFTLANCDCCNRSLSSSSRFLILRIARDSRKMIRGENEMLENANSGKLVAGVITFFNVMAPRISEPRFAFVIRGFFLIIRCFPGREGEYFFPIFRLNGIKFDANSAIVRPTNLERL